MVDRNRAFRTGESVVKPGNYVCEAGKSASYREGETFKVCPVSGKETTWNRDDDGCCC